MEDLLMKLKRNVAIGCVLCVLGGGALLADDRGKNDAQENGQNNAACQGLPTQAQLRAALVSARSQANGGFNLDMWGTIVNRDGIVCAVAFTGANRGDQWP